MAFPLLTVTVFHKGSASYRCDGHSLAVFINLRPDWFVLEDIFSFFVEIARITLLIKSMGPPSQR